MKVRNISVDGKRIADEEENKAVDQAAIDAIDNDEMYVCRCEEITKAEVIEAVRNGATSVNEVKRLLRTGMGMCQDATVQKPLNVSLQQN